MKTGKRKKHLFQIIHSFEGFVNDSNFMQEVLVTIAVKRKQNLENFEERLRRNLESLVERGVGGIVTNVSYKNYMNDREAWQRFVTGLEIAGSLGLRIWLYDESGYPSGSAGGLVLREHPEIEATGLKRVRIERDGDRPFSVGPPEPGALLYAVHGTSDTGKTEKLFFKKGIRAFKVESKKYKFLDVFFIASLYKGTHAERNYSAARRTFNVLDPESVGCFLKTTYLRYYREIPAPIWKNIEAIFTDEVSVMSFNMQSPPMDVLQEDPVEGETPLFAGVPWCGQLEERYYQETGRSLEDDVRSLFSGRKMEDGKIRTDFWRTVSQLYEQAYAVQAGECCAQLGVALTGHLFHEEKLFQHAFAQINPLNILKHYQRPGVDLLSSNPDTFHQYILSHKMVLSAAILGRRKGGIMTELSDFSEYWPLKKLKRAFEGENVCVAEPGQGATLRQKKAAIAFQFLNGVRHFAVYYSRSDMSREEHLELCRFVDMLCESAGSSEYTPECALFYPIEKMWAEYIPTEKNINKEGFLEQSKELRELDRNFNELCATLFRKNIQYILCDSSNLDRLPELGIRNLIVSEGVTPDEETSKFCQRHGITVILSPETYVKKHTCPNVVMEGGNIVYSTYGDFIFLMNLGNKTGSVRLDKRYSIAFPSQPGAPAKLTDLFELEAYEPVFLTPEERCGS